MADLSLEERLVINEKKAQRALDYQEITNVMSAHCYYHNVGKNGEEYDAIWAKDPGVKWTMGGAIYEGQENVKHFAVESFKQRRLQYLENLARFYPIEVCEDNIFMGEMACHPQTTPIIEVAGDGKTAKGVWYSPGIVASVKEDGKPHASWCWEMYGVDFIKEDGKWKIWHMINWYDFVSPLGKDFSDLELTRVRRANVHTFSKASRLREGGDPFVQYNPTRVPAMPPLPEPYETWDDSLSY